jgi:hypothetical protein
MPLLALAIVLLLPLALVVSMPLILFQRYRAGSRRRMARPWVARVNVYAMALSAVLFLLSAAVIGIWVPTAIVSAAEGMAVGAGLGVIGLWLSRWERAGGSLHYTPNRWLVLVVTLLIAARIVYGLARGLVSFDPAANHVSILSSFGIAGSLAVGAVVVGYYLAYAIGVRRRLRRWQNAN